jgi:hypothetical protein
MKKLKSWQITVGAVVLQLPILWNQVMTVLDGNPETNPSWLIISAVIAAIGVAFKAKGTNAPAGE